MRQVSRIISLVGGAVALGLGIAILVGVFPGEEAIPLLTVGMTAAGLGLVASAGGSVGPGPRERR